MERHVRTLRTASAATPVLPVAFTGVWNAHRKMVDHLARKSFVFEGVAVITPDKFDEQGSMAIEGRRIDVRRSYRLEMSDRIAGVLFPDGRSFIEIDERPSQHVEHCCGNDLYTGRLFFLAPDHWVEFWRVEGPRKRYSSFTRLTRRRD